MLNIYQVDCFTDTPFSGNPAGVCPLERPIEKSLMQSIANEMNTAETTFFWPERDNTFRLHWFTPEAEVPLGGYGTLAASHIIFELGLATDNVTFITNRGTLAASIDDDGITLDLPAYDLVDIIAPTGLGYSLGAVPAYLGTAGGDILVHLKDERTVRELDPDLSVIATLDCRGVIVTAHGDDSNVDYVSRFFVPGIGVNEDYVSASTHCLLGPYWANLLGKNTLTSLQLSKRIGGTDVTVEDGRVKLTGRAVTVIRGELFTG